MGPSRKAKNVLRKALRDIWARGDENVRRIERYLARTEGISEASILCGSGSTIMLRALLRVIEAKRILIPYPFSERHRVTMEGEGREIRTIALGGAPEFHLDVEEFCNAMEGCDLAIVPNPHDMTGSVVSPEDMTVVIQEAERAGVRLVVDEAYGDFIGRQSLAGQAARSRGTTVLRTFSTFHALAGLRLGYLVGPSELGSQIGSLLDPSAINSLAPVAALASLKDKAYQRRTLLAVEAEKAYLQERLARIAGIRCHVSPSNIVLARIQKDCEGLGKFLNNNGVHVETFVDGQGFSCVRIPVQKRRLNAYLVRILKRFMEA